MKPSKEDIFSSLKNAPDEVLTRVAELLNLKPVYTGSPLDWSLAVDQAEEIGSEERKLSILKRLGFDDAYILGYTHCDGMGCEDEDCQKFWTNLGE